MICDNSQNYCFSQNGRIELGWYVISTDVATCHPPSDIMSPLKGEYGKN